METKFEGTCKTVTGLETKGVQWNNIPMKYIGMVYDPTRSKFITCMWSKTGKCKNFPQFDLALPLHPVTKG